MLGGDRSGISQPDVGMKRREFVGLLPAALMAGSPGSPLPQFPTLAHQLVWRNWDLVPRERIARALGCSPDKVRQLAAHLHLAPLTLDPRSERRQRFQVLRRNWTFVPIDQLSVLVNMTPAEMTSLLAEDAFYVGHLGPKPVVPTVVVESAAPLRIDYRIVGAPQVRPRFDFASDLLRDTPQTMGPQPAHDFSIRIGFPYPAPYGNVLSDPGFDGYYSDVVLGALKAQGLNGIWLHGVLRELTSHALLPGSAAQAEVRIQRLNRLIAKCAALDLGVYLYLNEPRAMPSKFFKDHPEIKGDAGRPGDGLTSLCSSTQPVRTWLRESVQQLMERAPKLRGLILITASENPTNCYSIRRATACPRCRLRKPAAVIGEVVDQIRQGVHRVSPGTQIIAWDWSWGVVEDDPQQAVIAALPNGIILQVDFERGTPVERMGRQILIDEYSLSIPGPSPRAQRHIAQAHARRLPVIAKAQIGNSWEMSLLPFIPVPDLIAAKCSALRHAGVEGAMLSWTLGTWPSVNWLVAREYFGGEIPDRDQVLSRVAEARYGPAAVKAARQAWSIFSSAFAQYPYSNTLVYSSVVQAGPAHPLWLEPSGQSPKILNSFDSLAWTQPYGPEAVSAAFRRLAGAWEQGVAAFAPAASTGGPRAAADQRIHIAGQLHFASIANQVEIHLLRDRQAERARLRKLIQDELLIAEQFLPICEADARIGFESSLQYFYLPHDIREKILWCRAVLAKARKV